MAHPKIVTTGDGSSTLYHPETGEHYHSIHGAVTESEHVFISAGLEYFCTSPHAAVNIFEVGMGTGLNVLLTAKFALAHQNTKFSYHALEAYPIAEEISRQLHYPFLKVDNIFAGLLNKIHSSAFDEAVSLLPNFILKKHHIALEEFIFPAGKYDVVYFDAFAPDKQPELWAKDIFERIYTAMNSSGVFTTYSCKGEVKRNLIGCGFNVEKIPGPPHKREMLRAVKP